MEKYTRTIFQLIGRIALGISITNPDIIYALISSDNGLVYSFFITENGGSTGKKYLTSSMVIHLYNAHWTCTRKLQPKHCV